MSVPCTYIYVNSGLCTWHEQEFTYIYRHICTITYLYVHGINMYIHGIYRFYIPVQVQTCLYMVQTCLYRFAKSCPGGQDSRCWNLAIKVMDFDIEAWTPMYVYPYIEVPKLRYRSSLFWLRYRVRCWTLISKFLTSISKSLISQNFNIGVFRLRYRSTSTLKILRYWSNPTSKITSTSKLKFMYGYRSPVLQYRSFCDIEAILHRRLLRYWSWNSYTDIKFCTSILKIFDIEDLQYRRSLISKGIFFKYTGLKTARERGRLTKAAWCPPCFEFLQKQCRSLYCFHGKRYCSQNCALFLFKWYLLFKLFRPLFELFYSLLAIFHVLFFVFCELIFNNLYCC